MQCAIHAAQHLLSLSRWLQVTFTATVISASDAQLLGPSSGVVLFSVSGSNAFSYVHKTVLGSAKVSRAAVSGTASLTMHKDLAGLTLLPGLPCNSLIIAMSSCLLHLLGTYATSHSLLSVRPASRWAPSLNKRLRCLEHP